MYSGGSGLSIDIHFVDIELSYDVLSPLPTLLSKHFNHPHPYIEIATAISDLCVCVPSISIPCRTELLASINQLRKRFNYIMVCFHAYVHCTCTYVYLYVTLI